MQLGSLGSFMNGSFALMKNFAAQFAFLSAAISAFLIWQHVVSPKLAPKTHYQVLGVELDATAEDIVHAFKKLTFLKTLENGENEGFGAHTLQIQHAYEILSDAIRRRDYDYFRQDELQDKVLSLQRSMGPLFQSHELPLWEPFNYEPSNLQVDSLRGGDIELLLKAGEVWLIQIYSVGSRRCWQHERDWEIISERMDGVAKVGRVELGERRLAMHFSETSWATGGHFFRHGLPAYAALPPHCRSLGCIARYSEEVSVDGVVNWMATRVLRLPRILYYSPDKLVRDLIQKSGPHKVKVVIFSETGERAAPFLRKAAKDFHDFAVFGLVLWREEDGTFWESMFGLRSAPALLILRDPGVAPIIFYGKMNSSMLSKLLQANKNQVLPQLRSVTAHDLGCSELGYSLAGKNEHTWYCLIVAGRPGLELSQARAVLRDVKDSFTKEVLASQAASAFKERRMVLAWLDGYAQKQVCNFYLNSETVHETCGGKSFPNQKDVPRLFLIRYRRHPKDREKLVVKGRLGNSIWQKLLQDDEDIASQIVAKYDGLLEVREITSWVSAMIEEGDKEDHLVYMKKGPPLTPEDTERIWLTNAQTYVIFKMEGIYYRCRYLLFDLQAFMKNPRLISTLIFVFLLYVGGLFFRTKQVQRQAH